MKRYYKMRIGKMMAFGGFFILAAGLSVMLLWNALIPVIFGGVSAISFFQALGLLLLARLLVGGFGGRRWGGKGSPGHWRKHQWKHRFKAKWDQMSDEEKSNLKSKFKGKCGPGFMNNFSDTQEKQANDGNEDQEIEIDPKDF